jgi:hypothetical protein
MEPTEAPTTVRDRLSVAAHEAGDTDAGCRTPQAPTLFPSEAPTELPTTEPTEQPTMEPTEAPTTVRDRLSVAAHEAGDTDAGCRTISWQRYTSRGVYRCYEIVRHLFMLCLPRALSLDLDNCDIRRLIWSIDIHGSVKFKSFISRCTKDCLAPQSFLPGRIPLRAQRSCRPSSQRKTPLSSPPHSPPSCRPRCVLLP